MSSNKHASYIESTMSEALALFLDQDDGSHDKLLMLYSKTIASADQVISTASSQKPASSRVGMVRRKFQQQLKPLRRTSMNDVAKREKSMTSFKNIQARALNLPSNMKHMDSTIRRENSASLSPVARMNVKKLGSKGSNSLSNRSSKIGSVSVAAPPPPPSVMNFLAALNSKNSLKSSKSENDVPSLKSSDQKIDKKPDASSPSSTTRSGKKQHTSGNDRKGKKQPSGNDNAMPVSGKRKRRCTSMSEVDDVNDFKVNDEVVVYVKEEGGKFPAIIKACEAIGTFEVSWLV